MELANRAKWVTEAFGLFCTHVNVHYLVVSLDLSVDSENDSGPKRVMVHQLKFNSESSYAAHVCLAQLLKD